MVVEKSRRSIVNPGPDDMPRSADVVIIGGGMAGTAASFGLNRADEKIQTVVVETAETLAAGDSTRSAECIRKNWPTPALAAQMSASVDAYHHADEEIGEGASKMIQLNPHGYLYATSSDRLANEYQIQVEEGNANGFNPMEFIDASEIRRRYPWIPAQVVAAKFDPKAGSLNSDGLAQAYAKVGENAKFLLGMRNPAIVVKNGKVVGVFTEQGIINTDNVIIAAGAGSHAVGLTAGVDLPIVLRARESFVTAKRDPRIPQDAPFMIAGRSGAYMRPQGSGGIFGYEYERIYPSAQGEPADYIVEPVHRGTLTDQRFPYVTLHHLARELGDIFTWADQSLYLQSKPRHQAGFYVYRGPTNAYKEEDGVRRPYRSQRPIIGPIPGVIGVWGSFAHVGHGVMDSFEGGRIAADHVLGRPLRNPLYSDFEYDVHWVPNDGGGL